MDGKQVRMTAPEGATGCGWMGESYEVDEDNKVTVPEEAVNDLMFHGYKPDAEDAEEAVAKKSKRSRKE